MTVKLSFAILTIIIICSCNAQGFSKKESDFVDKVSIILNRANVTIKKGIVASSSEGRYNKFEIDIEDFKFDSVRSKTNILKASSIPAYLFLKDSIARGVDYRYVDVVVKTKDDQITTRYSIPQLLTIDSCQTSLNGYLYGLKELNKDSLAYYSEDALLAKIEPGFLVDQLKLGEQKVGKIVDVLLNGFRIDTVDNKELVYFSVYLRRTSGDNLVELWLDPKSKKVSVIDL